MEFKTIKLKDVLKQYRIEHRVLDHHMYKQVTISKHLGVCYRGEKIGAEIGRKRQFLIDLDKYPNTFMLVRQGVQDGSFGFAPVEVNKCIVTENMPMFSVVDIDRRYLELYLKSTIFRDALSKIKTSGSAQKSIHERQILELSITIPSKFSDQKRIVEKLENVKSANFGISSEITNQLNIIGKFRQAFLREAMQGKLVSNETSDGKTGAELLQEIQAEKEKLIKEQKIKKSKPLPPISEDEIPFEIPENWVWCRMGEISYITSGSTPSSDSFVSTGIPYFKMYNIKSQKIDFWHKPQYIKKEIHEGSLKRCRLFPGDVLMNIVGPPLGKLAIIPEEFPEANFNQAAVLIRSFKIEINQFIFWYLNEMSAINEIDTKGVAGQANISVTQAHNIKFPLPPYEVQKRIVSKLDVLMKYCDNLEKSVKESQNYNDQLLQQVLREALEGKDEVENENLQLVAEESPIYSIQNTINKNCDTGDMAILAGYIIKKLSTQNSKDFGRVKLQKMLHLVEYHCQLSSELKYQKNVAGPHAWELEHVIEPKLKSLRFFEIKKDKFGATSKVTYTPLSASNELSSLFNREFKNEAESINNLLDKFQDKTWEFCERISTMYAVWNNRLIRKEFFTDEILKQDFLAWDDKKKRFIDLLDHTLEWIRKEKIEPVGFGEYIDKK